MKTKPITNARLSIHQDVKKWFKQYHDILAEYKITKGKNVLNMDDSGRVRSVGWGAFHHHSQAELEDYG